MLGTKIRSIVYKATALPAVLSLGVTARKTLEHWDRDNSRKPRSWEMPPRGILEGLGALGLWQAGRA